VGYTGCLRLREQQFVPCTGQIYPLISRNQLNFCEIVTVPQRRETQTRPCGGGCSQLRTCLHRISLISRKIQGSFRCFLSGKHNFRWYPADAQWLSKPNNGKADFPDRELTGKPAKQALRDTVAGLRWPNTGLFARLCAWELVTCTESAVTGEWDERQRPTCTG
jgi:hypothetical protein